MAWRSRYFEIYAYRKLIIEYFNEGCALVVSAKPRMADDLYDYNYTSPKPGEVRFGDYECRATFDAGRLYGALEKIFLFNKQCDKRAWH